ncbi:MAG: L-histidine N(alpha)-methyltransferase [Bryobacteraceae bacterium]
MFFFPGSTIGNFSPGQARHLLQRLHRMAGPGGGLMLGVDLLKDPAVLYVAYNDDAGVTAQFNRNLLTHLNGAFNANVDTPSFRHEAPWVAGERRVEMQLWCERGQWVQFGDQGGLHIATGEKLVREWCHKYTI